MRPRIKGMTEADISILEYLAGHEQENFEQPPTLIAGHTGISATHTRRRVKKLVEAGLLVKTDDTAGYYSLSDLGQRYLSGEITEDERDEVERILSGQDLDEE